MGFKNKISLTLWQNVPLQNSHMIWRRFWRAANCKHIRFLVNCAKFFINFLNDRKTNGTYLAYLWKLNSNVNIANHPLHHTATGHWSAWKMNAATIPADYHHASVYNGWPSRWPLPIHLVFRRHHLANRCCLFLVPNWTIPF